MQHMKNNDWPAEKKLEAYHDYLEVEAKRSAKKSLPKKLLTGFLENWRQSKGFLNKSGQYFNFHEWHSLGLGVLLIDLYFRLSQGLFLVLYLAAIVRLWFHDKKKRECSHKQYLIEEIGNNVHYYIMGGAAAAVFWTEISGATPPEVSQGILSLVISAVLGV